MPNLKGEDNRSFLSKNSICDICEKPIRPGDVVKQVFQGEVKRDEDLDEMFIDGEYEEFHADCHNIAIGR